MSPRPVKLLAYADGVLLFINRQREFLELQEKLLIYSSASNSQINCHKPVAFLLSGRTLRNISFRNYIVQDQSINWFDVHPLSIWSTSAIHRGSVPTSETYSQIILLFPAARLDRSLTDSHPLSLLFQAMDCCPRDALLNPVLSRATCLILPLVDVCHIQRDRAFSFSRFTSTTRVADLLIQDSASGLLRYLSRDECLYPNIVSMIRTAVLQDHIQYHGFF